MKIFLAFVFAQVVCFGSSTRGWSNDSFTIPGNISATGSATFGSFSASTIVSSLFSMTAIGSSSNTFRRSAQNASITPTVLTTINLDQSYSTFFHFTVTAHAPTPTIKFAGYEFSALFSDEGDIAAQVGATNFITTIESDATYNILLGVNGGDGVTISGHGNTAIAETVNWEIHVLEVKKN